MKILLIIFLLLFSISVIIILYGKYEYINFIKKNADKYTIEEIDNIIQKDKAILEGETLYDKTYIDIILDNIELWEQIRNYKLHKKI
jgi:hypothetical protein